MPSLRDLSSNDMQQFLIGDLIILLVENIRNYLSKNSDDDLFAQTLKTYRKTIRLLHDQILDSYSPAIEGREYKDYWLLSYLVRNEITRQAFQDYMEHVHEK